MGMLDFENDRKLKKKTIRQWWKNKSDIFGPLESFDRMSQFIYDWKN